MSTTATLVNNVCYPSLDSAKDAFYSSMSVAFSTDSTGTYLVRYYKSSGVWSQIKIKWDNAGTQSVLYTFQTGATTFPDCDATAAYFDGISIGWGVVSAMTAVYAFILIRKAFFVP